MTKQDLIEVYEDTKRVCENIIPPISYKIGRLIFGSTDNKNGKIIIEPMDTISALEKYIPYGKTAVLNMASSIKKGGGVAKGAMAQEECLFRCSNLFTIQDNYYPLDIHEFIYSHDVTFVKSADFKPISIKADVITIAAPNINKQNKYYNPKDFETLSYEEQINMKIMQMLTYAHGQKCKNIILGAWGCGVFKNDPTTIANYFKDILDVKRHLFDNIVFAVINDKNSVGNNYQIFNDILK